MTSPPEASASRPRPGPGAPADVVRAAAPEIDTPEIDTPQIDNPGIDVPDAALPTLARTAGRYPGSRFYDDLARRATGGRLAAAALLTVARDVDRGDPAPAGIEWNARALAWFGHVTASRTETGTAPEDTVAVFALGRRVVRGRLLAPPLDAVWVQAHQLAGRLDDAREVLRGGTVADDVWWGAEADAMHPGELLRAGGDAPGVADWLAVINRPMVAHGLEPFALAAGQGPAFDRLTAAAPPRRAEPGDPLVSVVMPVFNPGPSVVAAVRSLTAQTWTDLDIVVADDCSTTGTDLLADLAAFDPRVRVIRAPVNRGAYAARNLGLGHARGSLVTFNDADDLSHPRRIERQVAALRADPAARACLSRSLRMTEDLHLTVMGRPPGRINLSSILIDRGDVLARLGGFDPVRRGADSEFVSRLGAVFGPGALLEIPDPLALVQLTTGSLSRDDFRFLRTHPARRRYQSAFLHWHRGVTDRPERGYVAPGARAPFPAPAAMLRRASDPPGAVPEVDVLLLGNPTTGAPTAADLASEAGALADGDLRIGHLEYLAPYDLTDSVRPAADDLAELIHRGTVSAFLPEEPVRSRLIVIRDPAAVHAMPDALLSALRAERVLVVADYAPARWYRPAEVATTLRDRITGPDGAPVRIDWLPATARIGEAVGLLTGRDAVLPPALYGCAPVRERAPQHRGPFTVGVAPAVGHHGSATDLSRTLERLVPATGGVVWSPSRAVGAAVPARALRIDRGEIDLDGFLGHVDLVVVDSGPGRGAHTDRIAVAALQRGRMPVLDADRREHFGDAAWYLGDRTVDQVVADLADERARARQQAAAAVWLERLSAATLRRHVGGVLAGRPYPDRTDRKAVA